MWGCHGGGTVATFAGTPHETRTCPRRTLLRNPDVVAVFELRREIGEAGLGVDGADSVTAMAIEALDVVEDGVAFRMKAAAELNAKLAAQAALDE
jgi:hypothetical protein